MTGDNTARFCTTCNQHVIDLSQLTRGEAEELVAQRDDGLCVRMRHLTTGEIVHRQELSVHQRARQWCVRVASGVAALAATVLGIGCRADEPFAVQPPVTTSGETPLENALSGQETLDDAAIEQLRSLGYFN